MDIDIAKPMKPRVALLWTGIIGGGMAARAGVVLLTVWPSAAGAS
jgi:hypothetical protein